MKRPTFLFHYGVFQPLWQQPGLIQCGPLILPGETADHVSTSTVEALRQRYATVVCQRKQFLFTTPIRF